MMNPKQILCANLKSRLITRNAVSRQSGYIPSCDYTERSIYVLCSSATALQQRTTYTKTLFYASFCFNVRYQFAPLFNLRPLIFGLTLFGWFISTYFALLMGTLFFIYAF
jgi:hypothetical protein